jgi:RecA-family ATPase
MDNVVALFERIEEGIARQQRRAMAQGLPDRSRFYVMEPPSPPARSLGAAAYHRGRTPELEAHMRRIDEINRRDRPARQFDEDEPPPESESGNGADDEPPLPKLVPLPYIEGETVTPQEWLIEPWVPMDGQATLFQGDGGEGKSTIAQQLQSSCATELPWLGLRVKGCNSVGFYTEDRKKDLLRRQAAIDAAYGLDCRSPDSPHTMHLFPRRDFDNELIRFTRTGAPEPTPFFYQVREVALDGRAKLVVLDVNVDLFGGAENERRQVRAFARQLNELAGVIDGSVFLTGHLSMAGIKSEGGHSGSTDWNNAFRSRAYLGRPKGNAEGEDEPQANARLITRKKANFAPIGETIKLHWSRGVFLPDEFISSQFRRPVDDVFLALLDAHEAANRTPLSESKNASNFAPRVFGRAPASERDGYGESDLVRAMERLFSAGKIIGVPYRKRGEDFRKIARKSQ